MDGAVPATGPRPRAVMVTKYYWPEPIGSAPFCAGLAGHLARGGLEVDVLTSRPHYPGGRVRADYRDGSRDRERHEGVAVHRVVPALFGSGALGRMVSDAAFLLRGGWAVARGRVAAAPLVVSVSPTVLATLLAGFLRTRDSRLVVLVHDIESGLASGLGMGPGMNRMGSSMGIGSSGCGSGLGSGMNRMGMNQRAGSVRNNMPMSGMGAGLGSSCGGRSSSMRPMSSCGL